MLAAIVRIDHKLWRNTEPVALRGFQGNVVVYILRSWREFALVPHEQTALAILTLPLAERRATCRTREAWRRLVPIEHTHGARSPNAVLSGRARADHQID